MGHDITAYEVKEIAYLRRNIFCDNESKNRIYELLDANNFNMGVSGNGEFLTIYLIDIKKALVKIRSEDKKDIIEFLNNCYDSLIEKKNDFILIWFN